MSTNNLHAHDASAANNEIDLVRLLGELLDHLPEKQREILVLRLVVGLSAEETAEMIGSTPGAVRVAQHRALTKLKKIIAAGGGR